MGSPSPSDSKGKAGTSSAKNETSDAEKKTDVVTQAEDFWSCLEEVDSDEMNDAQAEELKEQMEKLKIQHPDIYEEYASTSESRTFRIKKEAA